MALNIEIIHRLADMDFSTLTEHTRALEMSFFDTDVKRWREIVNRVGAIDDLPDDTLDLLKANRMAIVSLGNLRKSAQQQGVQIWNEAVVSGGALAESNTDRLDKAQEMLERMMLIKVDHDSSRARQALNSGMMTATHLCSALAPPPHIPRGAWLGQLGEDALAMSKELFAIRQRAIELSLAKSIQIDLVTAKNTNTEPTVLDNFLNVFENLVRRPPSATEIQDIVAPPAAAQDEVAEPDNPGVSFAIKFSGSGRNTNAKSRTARKEVAAPDEGEEQDGDGPAIIRFPGRT